MDFWPLSGKNEEISVLKKKDKSIFENTFSDIRFVNPENSIYNHGCTEGEEKIMNSIARDKNWRKKELSLKEVQEKYKDIPKSLILKADLQRRGLTYSQAAINKIDPEKHLTHKAGANRFRTCVDILPEGLLMRDGSYLVISNFDYAKVKPERDPYLIDVVDEKIVIVDQDEVLDEIQGYWETPDYYRKKASNGEPLNKYIAVRPQRLEITLNNYCHFWDIPGEGCKYCPMSPNFKKSGKTQEHNEIRYIREAFEEAVKQKGRNAMIILSGGSILSGKEVLDDELQLYIDVLKMLGEFFASRRFPSQLISSAFNERQQERLYEETGLMIFTPDIEVLNKEKFEWICPGKAHFVGYEEWKRRIFHAVDVFGKGNVTTGMVLGVEQAKPYGFRTEDEAFHAITEEAENIISHGVALAANIWRATPNSVFQDQDTPSLDYYIRTIREFDRLQRKYVPNPYTDDYRRCGAHVGLDLMRTYGEDRSCQ